MSGGRPHARWRSYPLCGAGGHRSLQQLSLSPDRRSDATQPITKRGKDSRQLFNDLEGVSSASRRLSWLVNTEGSFEISFRAPRASRYWNKTSAANPVWRSLRTQRATWRLATLAENISASVIQRSAMRRVTEKSSSGDFSFFALRYCSSRTRLERLPAQKTNEAPVAMIDVKIDPMNAPMRSHSSVLAPSADNFSSSWDSGLRCYYCLGTLNRGRSLSRPRAAQKLGGEA